MNTIYLESDTNSYQITLAKPEEYEKGYLEKPSLIFEREVVAEKEESKLIDCDKVISERCRLELTEEQFKKVKKYFEEVEKDSE